MRTSKIVSAALIAVLLGSTATSAYAGWSFHFNGPTLKHPFNPPSISATNGQTTYTATPTPVGPAVTSTGHGAGDTLLNKAAGPGMAANKALEDTANTVGQAAKDAGTAINKAVDDAGRGIGHFFNEIGMAWANFKNGLIDKAKSIGNNIMDHVIHYLILAGIGLAAILVLLPLASSYLTARFMRRAYVFHYYNDQGRLSGRPLWLLIEQSDSASHYGGGSTTYIPPPPTTSRALAY